MLHILGRYLTVVLTTMHYAGTRRQVSTRIIGYSKIVLSKSRFLDKVSIQKIAHQSEAQFCNYYLRRFNTNSLN